MRVLVFLVSTLLLCACAGSGPTPYQPVTAKSDYGYQDTKIDGETWRIEVAGNIRTSRGLVENQLLYRAAEIASANGAEGFVVLTRDVEEDTKYRVYPAYDPFYAYPYGSFWWGHHYYGGAGVGLMFGPRYYADPTPITRFTAFAEIQIFSGETPQGLGPTYVAAEVLENLKDKINRPKPKT